MLVLVLAVVSIMNGVYSECVYSGPADRTVTYCDLDIKLRAQLIEKFIQTPFHDFLARNVRLAFHDCMGPVEGNMKRNPRISICDGCISFANPAHAGVEEFYDKMERIYKDDVNNWDLKMSRADFWSVSAIIALQYADFLSRTTSENGATANPDQALPYIPFYIGRTDCSTSPDVNTDNYASPYQAFPDALAGFDANYAQFNQSFALTQRDYVALLGAHTLGRVKPHNSGFGTDPGNPWVQAWDVLDNEFYNVLLDDMKRTTRSLNWQQEVTGDGLNYEWRSEDGSVSGSRFVMLNADMALVKDLDNNINRKSSIGGECKCVYADCPDNSISRPFVEMYANDNQLWLTDFATAFTKMILAGYTVQEGLDSDLTVLATDEYLEEHGIVAEEIKRCDPAPYTDWSIIYQLNGARFRERDDGPAKLADATRDFLEQNPGCITSTDPNDLTTYIYDFYFAGKKDGRLTITLKVCCGDDAVWPSDFVVPPEFDQNGAFTGDADTDWSDDQIETKEIVVYCIIAVIILFCMLIIGYIFWRKYQKNKLNKNIKQIHEHDMSASNDGMADIETTTVR